MREFYDGTFCKCNQTSPLLILPVRPDLQRQRETGVAQLLLSTTSIEVRVPSCYLLDLKPQDPSLGISLIIHYIHRHLTPTVD